MPPFEGYLNTVLEEIAFYGKSVSRPLKSIYIGGGTPSILNQLWIDKIFECLNKHWAIDKKAEISIEANPESLTLEQAMFFKSAGAGRLSIGIQTYNSFYLKTLGRAATQNDNIKAIDNARKAGIDNINADLMFGLPAQTTAEWMKDLNTLLSFNPEHISAYMLTVPENTFRRNLPPEETLLEMLNAGMSILEDNGFRHYEISNFSKPGRECRHNLNYWNWGEYIGIGAGAHSFLQLPPRNGKSVKVGIRWWNWTDPFQFSGARSGARIQGYEYISPRMAANELAMLGLRKIDGMALSSIKNITPFDEKVFFKNIQSLIDKKFLICQGDRLKLTKKGIFVSNSIIAEVVRATETS